MYKIAICDDILSELDKTEQMLTLYFKEKNMAFTVERFEDAAFMLDKISSEEYIPDLIITDILIKEISGVDAVTKLREIGCDIPVIFTTVSPEYALEAYSLDVLQYLVKPLDLESFSHALELSFIHMDKEKEEKLILKMTDGICSVCANDIVYCETRKNYQILYWETGEQKARMTSLELYELLRKYPYFIKCGRSYILNMNHVTKINKEEVYMDNGDKIYLPRNKVTEFANTYFEYFCQVV